MASLAWVDPLCGSGQTHLSLISRVFHLRRCDNNDALSNSISPTPSLPLPLYVYIWIHLLAFISFRFVSLLHFCCFLFFYWTRLIIIQIFYLDDAHAFRSVHPTMRCLPCIPSFPLYSNGAITQTHTQTQFCWFVLLLGSGSGSGWVSFFYVFNIWSVLCLIISASDAQVQHFRLASTKQNKKRNNKRPTNRGNNCNTMWEGVGTSDELRWGVGTFGGRREGDKYMHLPCRLPFCSVAWPRWSNPWQGARPSRRAPKCEHRQSKR